MNCYVAKHVDSGKRCVGITTQTLDRSFKRRNHKHRCADTESTVIVRQGRPYPIGISGSVKSFCVNRRLYKVDQSVFKLNDKRVQRPFQFRVGLVYCFDASMIAK